MLGLMQNQPLLISSLIEFAERHHGEGEIVSRRVEGDIHRYTYKGPCRALPPGGQRAGWPEAGVQRPGGHAGLERLPPSGAVFWRERIRPRAAHLNPRLHPDQIAWIANHAEDQVLCFDMTFLPIVKAVHGRCPTVKHYVALCDADKLPADSGIPGLVSYEAWIGAQSFDLRLAEFDENSASSMCYTSGTTGNPKAALVQPPLDHAACLGGSLARCPEHERPRLRAAGGAHVPRQCLGHCRIPPP
jgi:hypothetical protein